MQVSVRSNVPAQLSVLVSGAIGQLLRIARLISHD